MCCTFCLRKVLRATTACNFSSLMWPKGSALAALATLLFDPPERQNIGKTQCFAAFPSFRSTTSSFFSLLLFSSLTLPTSAFPSVHIVGSLTSKLPSKNTTTLHYTTLITLHYTPLDFTSLHYLHYTTLNYTTLHYTTLRYAMLHYTTLH